MPAERFVQELNEQIGREFGASQQYLAAAVWYEDQTFPRLAKLFYDQAVEERGHALMMDRPGEPLLARTRFAHEHHGSRVSAGDAGLFDDARRRRHFARQCGECVAQDLPPAKLHQPFGQCPALGRGGGTDDGDAADDAE